jgi:putative DNA primase/helicase
MNDAPDYSRVLSRLERVRPSRSRPLTWYARCPVHGHDRSPSLALWVGRDGRLLGNCWACRCGWRRVVEATGTTPGDWFPPRDDSERGRRVARIVAAYPYHAEDGTLLYQVVRFHPKAFRQRRPANPFEASSRDGWVWNVEGVEKVPYRLPELLARPRDPVCVVEGEKDADALRALGWLATTNAGGATTSAGASKWELDFGRWLAGRRVAVFPDNDPPGIAHALAVIGTLVFWEAASIRLVSLPGLPPGGDVGDFLGRLPPDGAARKAELSRLIRQTPEWRKTTP